MSLLEPRPRQGSRPAHHRRTAGAVAAALAAASALAQSPPPTGPVSVVGAVNQLQTGGVLGEQRIGALCAPAFHRPLAPVGAGGVGLGGSIAWWSEAIHPLLQPPTHHTAGTCITLFFVAPFAFSSLPLPLTAPGFGTLFAPPGASLLIGAPWTQVHQTGGGGAVIPPGGFNRWYVTLDVPPLAALVGSVWMAQAMRLDPSNLLLYLSNDHMVQIWL